MEARQKLYQSNTHSFISSLPKTIAILETGVTDPERLTSIFHSSMNIVSLNLTNMCFNIQNTEELIPLTL
jgi:hypothetical protein